MASLCAIPLLLCSPIDYRPPPMPDVVGWWSQYAQAPTDMMISYHGFTWDVAGFIAVPDCRRVGDYAWITVNGSEPERVRVFDCLGANGDPAWWHDNRIIGELGFYLAREHGITGRGGVRGTIRWEDAQDYQPSAN